MLMENFGYIYLDLRLALGSLVPRPHRDSVNFPSKSSICLHKALFVHYQVDAEKLMREYHYIAEWPLVVFLQGAWSQVLLLGKMMRYRNCIMIRGRSRPPIMF